jgi:hypothetical protein
MNLLDRHLHKISLEIAVAFRELYHAGKKEAASDLLEAYRNVRRQISKGEDGKRYGSAEAGKAMLLGD